MPVNLEEMEQQAREIGRFIKKGISDKFGPRAVGFCLMLFDFGASGNTTYIADGERDDVISAIEELLPHLRRQ